jgi:hypothetical protein
VRAVARDCGGLVRGFGGCGEDDVGVSKGIIGRCGCLKPK